MTTSEAPVAHGEPRRRQSRGRTLSVWIVLVLAALLLIVTTFAVWINRVALNTPHFTDTSTALLANDEIRNAVATRAVDELFDSVDVQAEIEAQLPDNFKSLSGIATAGAREAAYQIADRALEQPRFQKLFRTAIRESHATLVDVLEGGGPRVSTEGGDVTLDLRALVTETANRIGVGEQLADRLPADAGQIVVLRSDQLGAAQDAFQLLKTLAWLLPILTLLAFAAAVVIARDRRRAVRGIGVVLVLVGFIGLLASRVTGNYIVDNLVAEQDTRPAAKDAWNILTEAMRSSFDVMFAFGLVVLLAAWLAGRTRHAVSARRALAPALRVRLWPYIGLALVALILVWTNSTSDFSRYFVILLVIALGIVWIEVMRAQTMREFPDATGPAILSELRMRMSGWWEQLRGPEPVFRRTAPSEASALPAASTPPAPAPTPTPTIDVTAQLTSLADLHARGDLTDEEYASAKARVLAGE